MWFRLRENKLHQSHQYSYSSPLLIACGSLSKEICVARHITETPRHILKVPNVRLRRMDLAYCHAIVQHGLRLRVFGPGRIRVAPGTLYTMLSDSNVEYPEDRCGPGGISNVCERISWDVVFHADAVNPNHYLLF